MPCLPVSTALCFAAGKGERMRPLTLYTPKPLLAPYDEPMLAVHVRCLIAAGISRIIINSWYLPDHIACMASRLQRHHPSIRIIHLQEHTDEPLETGGGICNALHHINGDHFITVNTDMLFRSDISYIRHIRYLRMMASRMPEDCAGVLMLVPKERAYGYSGAGDFTFTSYTGSRIALRSRAEASAPFVYPGVQLLPRSGFSGEPIERWGLRRYYEQQENRLVGTIYRGEWLHVGTPAALIGAARKYYVY